MILKRISVRFIALVSLAYLILLFCAPKTPGLYTFFPQLIPLALAIPFVFLKHVRRHFAKYLYLFSGISFLFLTCDYIAASHAGLLAIFATFVPLGLFLFVRFVFWNFKRLGEKKSLEAFVLSALSWGFYAFAIPPLPLGPAAFVFLVPWFIVLFKYPMPAVLFASFWSGMIYNAVNYYWIYNVINVGPPHFIILGLFLLVSFFSLYTTVAAYVFVKGRDFRFKKIPLFVILFPFFYAGLEMTRTFGDFSFPWSHLGYVLGNHLELLQTLSWIGIPGYTILILASNMVVAAVFVYRKRYAFLAVPVLLLLLLALHGNLTLSKPEAAPFYNANPEESPVISMVQPSIRQSEKWSRDLFRRSMDKTWQLVRDSVPYDSVDIIVLAETAISDFIKKQPREVRHIENLVQEHQISLFTGALDYERKEATPESPAKHYIYNAGFLFSPDSAGYERYIKVHLVPFSERIPFDDIFPLLNYVNFGEGDFTAGDDVPVFGRYQWSPFICYDAIYGAGVRKAIRNGSRLMINITNDGWFGLSTAPGQHLNLVKYRAIENGYPIARCTNSGISAFIDQYGNERQNTELLTDRVITERMPLRTRDTLYSHIGDVVEIGLLVFFGLYILALAGCYYWARRRID
ncbi:MAG: apolipoprotein N-acyltransferase [Fibrobacter sp.]|jgi:apolipoprotein N-acyltransferase|nr:apolipoprotein N-acyltransferase [Fibrobacter sp.]